jgi:hypothetical protein
MGFIIEILGEQGLLACKVLTHVNTPKGAGMEAEWLLVLRENRGHRSTHHKSSR